MARRKTTPDSRSPAPVLLADRLLDDLRQVIEAARARVAAAANTELTLLYWRIGRSIHSEILSGGRAPMARRLLRRCHNDWLPSTAGDSPISP